MDDKNSLYIPNASSVLEFYSRLSPLVEAAQSEFKCTRGTVAIEMMPAQPAEGSILLPDRVAGRLRPDVGVVVSSGVSWLKPKDIVAVRPYDGLECYPKDELFDGYKIQDRLLFVSERSNWLWGSEHTPVGETVIAKLFPCRHGEIEVQASPNMANVTLKEVNGPILMRKTSYDAVARCGNADVVLVTVENDIYRLKMTTGEQVSLVPVDTIVAKVVS